MIPDGSCTRLLLLSGCCSLQDEFLRAWSLPPISPTSNSSLMVVSLLLDGIFLPATAVLDLLDRLRAGYFDLVVILPPQLTGSLQLDSLWGSSQSAAVPSDHPGSAQLDPAVSAAKAVLSQWELCAWTAEQALAHSATNLFLWTVEQPGAAQRSFSSTTEFQKLGRFHDARREDSAVHQLTSVDSWPIVLFLTDIPVALSPTLGLHSVAPGPKCALPHTSPSQVSSVPNPSFSPGEKFCSALLHAYLSRELAPPLRDRGSGSFSVASTTWSLAQSPGSRATLYDCWLKGTLNSDILANFTNAHDIEKYMGGLGARRSTLLDLLGFSSSSGDTASSVFPLWFSGRSVVSVPTASPFSHAGSGCKRILSSKGFRRAKKLKNAASLAGGLKDGVSVPGEMGPLGVKPPISACPTDLPSRTSSSPAPTGRVVVCGGTAATSRVIVTTTGTTTPRCSQAPLAPLEQRELMAMARLPRCLSLLVSRTEWAPGLVLSVFLVSFKLSPKGHDMLSRTPRVRNECDSQSHGCFKGNGTHDLRRSALGGVYADTPWVVPARGCLDSVRRLLRGDLYIGRGCRQRGLAKSCWCNDYKASVHGRATAISKFSEKLQYDDALRADVWSLSGLRLLCHCTPMQSCHADVIIGEYRRQFPDAYDREATSSNPPGSEVLNFLARLREEDEKEEGSSADEGVHRGWQGRGEPMLVGTGHTARQLCDGQTLASPGRWPPEQRRYPEGSSWKQVSALLFSFAREWGTPEFFMKLAVGRVKSCPFPEDSVLELKRKLVEALESSGHGLGRTAEDRDDVPVDYRLLQSLLTAAQDPEVGLGDFALGVRVGPGARLPRLPALAAKRRWRLPEQEDPLVHQRTGARQREPGTRTTGL